VSFYKSVGKEVALTHLEFEILYTNYADTSVETRYDPYTGAPIRSFYDPNARRKISSLPIRMV
jgi:hypothetical protein